MNDIVTGKGIDKDASGTQGGNATTGLDIVVSSTAGLRENVTRSPDAAPLTMRDGILSEQDRLVIRDAVVAGLIIGYRQLLEVKPFVVLPKDLVWAEQQRLMGALSADGFQAIRYWEEVSQYDGPEPRYLMVGPNVGAKELDSITVFSFGPAGQRWEHVVPTNSRAS